jgi:type VI secretion system protein VasG
MLIVDLKQLVGHLNGFCKQALEGAAGICLARTHYEITTEHLLRKLLDEPASDFSLLLSANQVDLGVFRRGLDEALEGFKSGNSGRPVFSPLLLELFQDAWLISSVNLVERQVRSGAILAAVVGRATFYASGDYVQQIRALNRDVLLAGYTASTAGSLEETMSDGRGESGGNGVGAPMSAPGAEGSAIAKFCEDFTAKAKAGKLDPVFGRDEEIRQMVDILARRRKNNPICVGDPGVGKSAVVEGLALRIVQGDVPDSLKSATILGLDMASLQAGASVKGEFENRLKSVINEIKGSSKPIILFIDEAHTLIGSGGAAGTNDAANLLKPALARGELKTIAATTWAEYKKYFEKDAALARRFQLVGLDEPTVATAVVILRGLRESYEQAHHVVVRDDAIVAAAELAARYITGRQLPDKAVDLLDTACARVKVALSAKPAELEDKERVIQALEREQKGLLRDRDHQQAYDSEKLADIEQRIPQLQAEVETIRLHWDDEKNAAEALLAARAELAQLLEDSAPEDEVNAARNNLSETEAKLKALQGDNALIRVEVDPDVIAKVVSDWTGIPLGKMLRDQIGTVLHLAEHLKARVRGQDEGLDLIAEVIKTSKSGLKDPHQPVGVFLLVGPSGVGKTETALALADLLFGDERSTITINMSEFQEKHNVSRLIGSPPGYVGYGEGGVLTEAVRKQPYSVVLLDEVEKAHLDVMNLFYQVFDKGVLSDGEGKEIDFSNTIIFLTSNLATDVITEMTTGGDPVPRDVLLSAVRPILSAHFKPALLARMTVIPYRTLGMDALTAIIRLKLDKIVERLRQNNKIQLSYDDAVVTQIAERCTEIETGARNIDFILRSSLLPQLSQIILTRMTEGVMLSAIGLGMDAEGAFTIIAE